MNIKTIIITGLCLIMLTNTVLGNTEINNPENYFLTETPLNFAYVGDMSYSDHESQEFASYLNIRIYAHIYTFSDNVLSTIKLRNIINEFKQSNGTEAYYTITEIYGLGDEAYNVKVTNIKYDNNWEELYFSKDHVLVKIYPKWESDIESNEESELLRNSFIFAKAYEGKINSYSNQIIFDENILTEKTTPNKTPFLNPFIVISIIIILSITMKKSKGEQK